VTNVEQAIKSIGATPILEFKLLSKEGEEQVKASKTANSNVDVSGMFLATGLTGGMLQKYKIINDETT
jgi:hypothetical protein